MTPPPPRLVRNMSAPPPALGGDMGGTGAGPGRYLFPEAGGWLQGGVASGHLELFWSTGNELGGGREAVHAPATPGPWFLSPSLPETKVRGDS